MRPFGSCNREINVCDIYLSTATISNHEARLSRYPKGMTSRKPKRHVMGEQPKVQQLLVEVLCSVSAGVESKDRQPRQGLTSLSMYPVYEPIQSQQILTVCTQLFEAIAESCTRR